MLWRGLVGDVVFVSSDMVALITLIVDVGLADTVPQTTVLSTITESSTSYIRIDTDLNVDLVTFALNTPANVTCEMERDGKLMVYLDVYMPSAALVWDNDCCCSGAREEFVYKPLKKRNSGNLLSKGMDAGAFDDDDEEKEEEGIGNLRVNTPLLISTDNLFTKRPFVPLSMFSDDDDDDDDDDEFLLVFALKSFKKSRRNKLYTLKIEPWKSISMLIALSTGKCNVSCNK